MVLLTPVSKNKIETSTIDLHRNNNQIINQAKFSILKFPIFIKELKTFLAKNPEGVHKKKKYQ